MFVTEQITLKTRGNGEMVDITPEVAKCLAESGLSQGTVTVFVAGSTAGVTTIEYEPGLAADMADMFERVAPEGMTYGHNQRWGDGNGHAHVRASLLGPSLVMPFQERRLLLGTWQQVVVVDFDNRARTRPVIVQISGE